MELSILYQLQKIHTDLLDAVMVFFTTLGNGGIIWLAAAAIMICWKKTRRCGITTGVSLGIMFLSCNVVLKNLVQRGRPCWEDTTVKLLIHSPSDYSFPSGHTFAAFAAAFCIRRFYKKAGIAAYILASVIAFSRMYLFVHYPTDILGGAVLGILTGMLACCLNDKYHKKTK